MPKVSILIPTKNGEKYLEEVLGMIFVQKVDFDYEVIIVDSGSKDRTLEIIKKFQKLCLHPQLASRLSEIWKQAGDKDIMKKEGENHRIKEILKQIQDDDVVPVRDETFGIQDNSRRAPRLKLYRIPPQEFGHGKTRNFAVSKADLKSKYLVFLTQDATPADENWLKNIITPLEQDSEVAGVFGRHLPRKDCDPFQRKTLNLFMESFGKEITVYQLTKPDSELTTPERHFLNYFSNVNSAVRRSVFKKIPFRDVEMGEDQFWIKDILAAGYKKAYAPKAAVYHSHNYGVWNQFKRWFDEFRQHKINQNYIGVSSVFKIPLLTLRLWFSDVRYIKSQKEYNLWQKIYWSLWIFFMDFARICAEYIGGRYERLPLWLQNRLSMQHELMHR